MAVWLVVGLLGAATVVAAEKYTIFEQWNAIPSGNHTSCTTLDACRDSCTAQTNCVQFTFNEEFKVRSTVRQPHFNSQAVLGVLHEQFNRLGRLGKRPYCQRMCALLCGTLSSLNTPTATSI